MRWAKAVMAMPRLLAFEQFRPDLQFEGFDMSGNGAGRNAKFLRRCNETLETRGRLKGPEGVQREAFWDGAARRSLTQFS